MDNSLWSRSWFWTLKWFYTDYTIGNTTKAQSILFIECQGIIKKHNILSFLNAQEVELYYHIVVSLFISSIQADQFAYLYFEKLLE